VIGLAIDQNTNDLYLAPGGNIAFARGGKAVAELARQRMMTSDGEWFLDTTIGLPWVHQILKRPYQPSVAEAYIKTEIIETRGVQSLDAFSCVPIWDTRRLDVKATITVDNQQFEVTA
jgi:hypothetical protein